MRKRVAVSVGVGAVLLVIGGGVASGAFGSGGGDDGPSSHQYTPAEAQAATKAALEATSGGHANSVETDHENGATYEVEVTKPDGTTVDVRLDENYEVVDIEGDGETG
jgi:hypothetical protein